MQNIKKEPVAEPQSERVDGQDDQNDDDDDAANDKVPEDVSLNTPVSNHEDAAENNENDDDQNGSNTAATNNSSKVGESGIADDIEEGGDLEGSVTAESPVQNFDSDEENDIDKSVVNGTGHETGSNFNKPETTSAGPTMKETSAEDDLLTSTEATSMEEGDEQYKNMIAETQMDNIFN